MAEIHGFECQQVDAGSVAGTRTFEDMTGIDVRNVREEAAAGGRVDRPVTQRCAGGERLETASGAAGADGAVLGHTHMAEMPGYSLTPVQKSAVDHRAATDAGADRQIDDIPHAAAGTVPPFTQCRGDGVILDMNGDARPLGEGVSDGKPVPTGQGRNSCHLGGFGVDRAGKRQADALDLGARAGWAQPVDQHVDLVHDARRPAGDIRRHRLARQNGVVLEQRKAQLRAADIDRYDPAARHVTTDPAVREPRPCVRQGRPHQRQAIP